MKKINYLLLGAAGLMLASCSQDDLSNANGNADGNLSVTVKLPASISSRADFENFGEGYQALILNYAVYDNGTLVLSNIADFPDNSLETTLNLNLAKGKNYDIAFFAQSQASMNSAGSANDGVYVFDAEAKTVTVNYENMTSANNLNDAYDCFYGVIEAKVNTGTVTLTAELFRPVGQVNWGTSDLTDEDGNDSALAHQAAYGTQGQYIQTNLKVVKPYNTLNLLTGEATQVYDASDTDEVIIEAMAAPYTMTFPVDAEGVDPTDYVYVAMTYILAPSADPTLYDLNLNIDNGNEPNVGESATGEVNTEVEVSAAPVQANYQTNIYGNLLSSNVIINITKNPTWKTPAYDIPLTWDGTTVTIPELPEDKSEPVVINDAATLAGLAALVNGDNGEDPNDLKDYTFELGADLDMGGNELPQLGSVTSTGNGNVAGVFQSVEGNAFAGTFDGKGYTISNVKVAASTGTTDPQVVGVFPNVTGTVKDVNFAGIVIEGQSTTNTSLLNATGVVGVLNGGTVDNVNVTSGTVKGGNYTAGVVGAVIDGEVKDCNNGANVTGLNNVGGVVGGAYGVSADADITIDGCNNSGTVTGAWTTGGVIGISNATVTDCENTGNVVGGYNSIGGVVAEQRTSGSISGCKNSGNVIATEAQLNNNYGYGIGGVVGWIRYIPQGENKATTAISVTGCENSGSIKGGIGAGGIVGIWYAAGTCSGNNNSADSITAVSAGAGGIVGQTNPSTQNNAPGQSAALTLTSNTSTTAWNNLSSPTNNKGEEQRGLLVGIDDGQVTYTSNTPANNLPN